MTLSGRLESIPLPEVLRLLARSRKTGCLRVEAAQTEGKIYLDEGALIYSTTRREDDLRSDLLNAGFVSAEDWISVERRETDLDEVLQPGRTPAELRDFLAEQGTEVIFRLQRPGRGQFDFHDGQRPRHESGQSVDIEKALAEAEHRVAQWAEIEAVIPSTKHRIRMAPTLPSGARDVTVTSPTWRLLAALGGQATVEEIAERIGSTEFVVAQALASMVRTGLVELSEQLATPRYTYEADDYGEVTIEGSEDAVVENSPSEDPTPSVPEIAEVPIAEVSPADLSEADLSETDLSETEEGQLLGELLSGIDDNGAPEVEILKASYDEGTDVEGSLSERANAQVEVNELRALANELTDLSE